MFALDQYIEVPYSNGSYFIDQVGNVLDSSYHHIQKIKGDNKKYKVRLNWINGFDYYDLDLVICIAYYNPHIPISILLNEIEVCYSDNDSSNNHINNLYYKFKSRTLEVLGVSGLFYIPYYTQYAIDKEYNLYRLSAQNGVNKLAWNRQSNNYWRNRKAKNDFNQGTGIMRHRAIGLTFIDYSDNPSKLQINHINSIRGDDRIENLEWLTSSANNLHSYSKPNNLSEETVECKRIIDNRVLLFNSIKAVSIGLDINESFVKDQLGKKELDFSPPTGHLFKYRNDPWPVITNDKKTTIEGYTILAKNVFTDEFFIFDSVLEAHKKLNLSIDNITNNFLTNSYVPLSGYLFREMSFKDWPEYTKYHLRVFKRIHDNKRPLAYFFIDKKDKEFFLFIGRKEIKECMHINDFEFEKMISKGKLYEYTLMKFDYMRSMSIDEINSLKGLSYINLEYVEVEDIPDVFEEYHFHKYKLKTQS